LLPASKSRTAVWVALALWVLIPAAMGQDKQTDEAQSLFNKGVAQYKAKEFTNAKKTFLDVEKQKDRLTDAQRKDLDQYLRDVGTAVAEQASAMEAFKDADAAVKANDLAQGKALYEKVAASKFVTDAVAKAAKQKVAEVADKIKAQAAAGGAAATRPAGATTTRPAIEDVRLQALAARIRKAKAEIAKGNAALENDRIDLAITHFERAIKMAPNYEPAHERLATARAQVGQASGAAALTRLDRMQAIRLQETRVRYGKAILKAREALQVAKAPEGFVRAREEAGYAKNLLATHKSLFSDSEYRQKKVEIDKLLEFISLSKARWEKAEVLRERGEVKRLMAERTARVRRQKAEQIRILKVRARTLRNEQKFAEAVKILKEIRKLDPDDTWAAEWDDQLSRLVLIFEQKNIDKTFGREEVESLVEVQRSAIPWHQLLRFPADWLEISKRRERYSAGQAVESEANRNVRKHLARTLTKLDFTGIAFNDVIDFLRDATACNIYVNWGALQAVGIDKNTPVNVRLVNVTFEKALKTILKDVGGVNPLGFIVDDGVITISTQDDLSRQTLTRVYDIRDLIVRVPNFSGPELSLSSMGNNDSNNGTGGGGGGGLFGGNNGTGGNNAGGGEENMISRQELIDNILDLIRSVISPDSWAAASGTIGSIGELGGQIVVKQTAQNHRDLVDLLAQLREARTLQINIESRFIRVSSGFLNRIGIDLQFYFNLGSRLGSTFAVDPYTGAIAQQRGGTSGWGGPGNRHLTPIPLTTGSYAFASPAGTGIGENISSIVAADALDVRGTFLDDVQVDFIISATQAHSATRTLTAPRITIYNGQRAYITVGLEQAYISGYEPEIAENVAAFRPIVSTVVTGTVLDVEGTISADRRYVTMTIRPQVTEVLRFWQWQGTAQERGTGLIELPEITVRKMACTVAVPDGGTLLVGGQKLAAEGEREMGVPIISKIPILRRAFTNRGKVRDEETLLILMKPKIIINREYEDLNFPP